MRLLLLVSALASSALLAHPGHGATPAHAHFEQLPVDIGAIVCVGLLGLSALLTMRGTKKRR